MPDLACREEGCRCRVGMNNCLSVGQRTVQCDGEGKEANEF